MVWPLLASQSSPHILPLSQHSSHWNSSVPWLYNAFSYSWTISHQVSSSWRLLLSHLALSFALLLTLESSHLNLTFSSSHKPSLTTKFGFHVFFLFGSLDILYLPYSMSYQILLQFFYCSSLKARTVSALVIFISLIVAWWLAKMHAQRESDLINKLTDTLAQVSLFSENFFVPFIIRQIPAHHLSPSIMASWLPKQTTGHKFPIPASYSSPSSFLSYALLMSLFLHNGLQILWWQELSFLLYISTHYLI